MCGYKTERKGEKSMNETEAETSFVFRSVAMELTFHKFTILSRTGTVLKAGIKKIKRLHVSKPQTTK